MEEQAALQDGQVVFFPVPQLTQVLVIESVEGILPVVKKTQYTSEDEKGTVYDCIEQQPKPQRIQAHPV